MTLRLLSSISRPDIPETKLTTLPLPSPPFERPQRIAPWFSDRFLESRQLTSPALALFLQLYSMNKKGNACPSPSARLGDLHRRCRYRVRRTVYARGRGKTNRWSVRACSGTRSAKTDPCPAAARRATICNETENIGNTGKHALSPVKRQEKVRELLPGHSTETPTYCSK